MGCRISESVIQEHVIHMTGDITEEIEKGQEATHNLIRLVRTTGLTDLTSCTGYTDLMGAANRFDQLADLSATR
jgi:hypothetical protein